MGNRLSIVVPPEIGAHHLVSACVIVSLSVQTLEQNKLKELKNGRLAMLAFVGFVAQHAATGKVRPFPQLHSHRVWRV